MSQVVLMPFNFYHRKDDNDEDVKIVAVDLQAMAPLPGVIQIQGDITKVRFISMSCSSSYVCVDSSCHVLSRNCMSQHRHQSCSQFFKVILAALYHC